MERAEIVALIRAYAQENWAMCTDGILNDPLLHGEAWTDSNVALSDDCATDSVIHSAKYHAAKDILELLGEDASDL